LAVETQGDQHDEEERQGKDQLKRDALGDAWIEIWPWHHHGSPQGAAMEEALEGMIRNNALGDEVPGGG